MIGGQSSSSSAASDWYPIDIISEQDELKLSVAETRELIRVRRQCVINAEQHEAYCTKMRNDAVSKAIKLQAMVNEESQQLVILERAASESLNASVEVISRFCDEASANNTHPPFSAEENTATALAGLDASQAELMRRSLKMAMESLHNAEQSIQSSTAVLGHAVPNTAEAARRLDRSVKREVVLLQQCAVQAQAYRQQQEQQHYNHELAQRLRQQQQQQQQ